MAINLGAKKEEVSKLTSNFSKTLTPRSEVCTINGVSFRKNDYKNQDGYDVSLILEGADITEQGFEGFFIDKDNPSLGRHKGPVGNVALSQWSFASKVWPAKNGKPEQVVDRDSDIIAELGKVARLVNKIDALFEGEEEDIEAVMNKASEVFKGTKINVLIAGQKYEKNGFLKYNLFVPKAEKGFYNMEAPNTVPSKLQPFDPAKHIIEKKAAATVDSFEVPENEFATTDDFVV